MAAKQVGQMGIVAAISTTIFAVLISLAISGRNGEGNEVLSLFNGMTSTDPNAQTIFTNEVNALRAIAKQEGVDINNLTNSFKFTKNGQKYMIELTNNFESGQTINAYQLDGNNVTPVDIKPFIVPNGLSADGIEEFMSRAQRIRETGVCTETDSYSIAQSMSNILRFDTIEIPLPSENDWSKRIMVINRQGGRLYYHESLRSAETGQEYATIEMPNGYPETEQEDRPIIAECEQSLGEALH